MKSVRSVLLAVLGVIACFVLFLCLDRTNNKEAVQSIGKEPREVKTVPTHQEKLRVSPVAQSPEAHTRAVAVAEVRERDGGASISDALSPLNPTQGQKAQAGANSDAAVVKKRELQTKDIGGHKVSFIKNQLIVKITRGASEQEINDLLARHNLTLVENPRLKTLHYISLLAPEGMDILTARKALVSDPQAGMLLRAVDPNYVANTMTIEDPLYAEQWYLASAGVDRAWDVIGCENKVIVAVVDTGVDANHPDLIGRCLAGINTVSDGSSATDDHGHGTFTAGLIASTWNTVGIRGVCSANVEILPVKALDADGLGTYEDAAEGIVAAADAGARVVNLGFGGYASSDLLRDAVDYAVGKGCILVAAGGNDGSDAVIYPAGYPDVIGVGAVGKDGEIADFSNRGGHIDVVAPGEDVLSATLENGYQRASGTSCSAALVSGAAALLLGEKPELSLFACVQLISSTAKDIGVSGRDTTYGSGLIAATELLTADARAFHDLAVTGIDFDSLIFDASKPAQILVSIRNNGTYADEICDVVLCRVVDGQNVELGRQTSVTVNAVTIVPFLWIPQEGESNIVFQAVFQSADDSDDGNNSEISCLYQMAAKGNLYALYKTEPPVHQWIAYQAFNKLKSLATVSTYAKNEFQAYIGATSDIDAHLVASWNVAGTAWDDWLNNEPACDGYELLEGTWEEDKENFGTSPLNHFWCPHSDYYDGIQHSALETAQSRFSSAVDAYQAGNLSLAYYYLGRTSHLLMDMSVPAHVAWYAHMGGDSYETYTASTFRNYSSNSQFTDVPDYNSLEEHSIPNDPGNKDYLLTRLIWNLAEHADDFGVYCQASSVSSWEQHSPLDSPADRVLGLSEAAYLSVSTQQQHLETRAIGYVAALYKLFLERTAPYRQMQVTVAASPSGQGLKVKVDGTTYTESQTFTWERGSSHLIEAVAVSGYSYYYWSDGGAQSHSVAPTEDVQYVATFKTQEDPYVILTASDDTFVMESYPATSFGNLTYMMLSGQSNNKLYPLIKFNVSSIPAGSQVSQVELRLKKSEWGMADSYAIVNLYRVGSSWSESTTWNTRPTTGTFLGSLAQGNVVNWYFSSSEIPALLSCVQGWLNGTSSNYGFMLDTTVGAVGYMDFYSSEASSTYRPKLVVYYTPPPTGSLTVNITPTDARSQGAQWRLTSGPDTSYHNSGDTIADLPIGNYTLYFNSLSGWTRPVLHNTSIAIGAGSNSRSGDYGFNVSAPTGVSASDAAFTDKVALSWNASDGATSYEVWRHISNTASSSSRIADYVAGVSFNDYTAIQGQLYYYWVKAKNGAGTTTFSASDAGSAAQPAQVATPVLNPDGGAYSVESVNVTVGCLTEGATLRYTTNGSDPTEASTEVAYSSVPGYGTGGTLTASVPCTLKVKAWKTGLTASAIKSADYTTASTVATPTFDPDGGTFAGSSVNVTVSCGTTDATIHYTTNGDEPTEASSSVASGGSVSVPVPGTLRAKAWKTGMTASGIKSATYAQESENGVTIDGNSMWNSHAYFSWQNITHVYQSGSDNAVIDTWKVDDNGNGDPRDDENRILLNGRTDGAFGIYLGCANSIAGQEPGWTAQAVLDEHGNGVLTFTRSTATGTATATYTLTPDSGDLYGEVTFQTTVAGDFYWGVSMINSVWVNTNPGEMALYNQGYLDGTELDALASARTQDWVEGEDYLQRTGVRQGVAAVLSATKDWKTAFELTDASEDTSLRAAVQMSSEYGGWGFGRLAQVLRGMQAGEQITLRGIFKADVVSTDKRNVALASNGGTASAGSVGTYLSVSHPAVEAIDGDPATAWCNSWLMPDWLKVEFDKTYLISDVGIVWGEGTHNQDFSISLSEDGANWTVVVPTRASATDAGDDGGGYHGNTTLSRERFSITPMRARFIRADITATSAPASHIFKAIVHELQAFTDESSFQEDFEAYPVDNWPDGWVADANAIDDPSNNRVVVDPSDSENQVLKFYGVLGAYWGALAYYPIEMSDALVVECRVYNGTETIPTSGHQGRAGIGFKTGTHWWNYGRGLIDFGKDGTVYLCDGTTVGPLTLGAWHSLRMSYQRLTASVEISYWIDGAFCKKATAAMAPADEDTLSHLVLAVNAGSAYFDDVVVRSVSTPAPSSDAAGWRYPRLDRIGHACVAQGSTVQVGNALALQAVVPDVSSVLTGDVDGDSVLDIVTCSGTVVNIYDGAGVLKQTFGLPRTCFLSMLEDVDGDGMLDIFLGSNGSGFSAYVYKGDGTLLKTFTGQHSGGTDSWMSPIGLSHGKVLMGYNAGYARTPRGVAAFDYATTNELWYYQIGPANGLYSVADIDGDGDLEITMSSATVHNGVSGNGTTDGDMYVIVVDENGVCSLSQKYATPSDGVAFNLFADLNGDGNQEILGFRGHDTYYTGQATVFGFGQDGTTLSSFGGINNDSWVGATWNGSYAFGDLEDDGDPEVVATGGPSLTTYVLDANLAKLCETNLPGEVKLIADINGDGLKEVVLLSSTGLLTVADRRLNVLSSLQVGSTGGNVIASDVTGDGILELLCRTDKLYVIGLFGGERNIALSANGAVATAESVGTYLGISNPAANANDGDTVSAWANSWSMPTWLQIEFDGLYSVDKVGVVWGVGAHNQTYSISLSENGSDWTVVVPERASATDAGDDGSGYHGNTTLVRESFPISPCNARFMRIYVTETSAPSSHIFKSVVHEFEAFGTPVLEPLVVTTTVMPGGMVSTPYGSQVDAVGGSAPYSWSVRAGYAESLQYSSFDPIEGAVWQSGMDAVFSLELPFAFPFYGTGYTTCFVDIHGCLSFAAHATDWEPGEEKLASRPMLAAMWNDYYPGDVTILTNSSADSVTVTWMRATDVNYSVTLHHNGQIVLKYGAGNGDGGMIGISSGTGENYLVCSLSDSGSMENQSDIVLQSAGALPDGLSLSSDGIISGSPSADGTWTVMFCVQDRLGVMASKALDVSISELTTSSGIPVSWLSNFGLPTDGSIDYERLNGSAFTVWQEWRAGTNPNDPADDLRMTEPPVSQPSGFRIRWRSVATRTYRIERSTNLLSNTPFTVLDSGIPGVDGVSEYIDSTADGSGAAFYRVLAE